MTPAVNIDILERFQLCSGHTNRKTEMTNFNRMTIRYAGAQHAVYKLKPNHRHAGAVSGGGHRLTTWTVSAAAAPRFTGTYAECQAFIAAQGAEFMSEHGLPV